MRRFLIVFLIMLSSLSFQKNYIVEEYKEVPGMDYQMELVLRDQELNHRMLLDCQSFINGLHYMDRLDSRWHDEWFLMLSGNDCEDVSVFSQSSFEKGEPYCLSVNLQDKEVNFNSSLLDCGNN